MPKLHRRQRRLETLTDDEPLVRPHRSEPDRSTCHRADRAFPRGDGDPDCRIELIDVCQMHPDPAVLDMLDQPDHCRPLLAAFCVPYQTVGTDRRGDRARVAPQSQVSFRKIAAIAASLTPDVEPRSDPPAPIRALGLASPLHDLGIVREGPLAAPQQSLAPQLGIDLGGWTAAMAMDSKASVAIPQRQRSAITAGNSSATTLLSGRPDPALGRWARRSSAALVECLRVLLEDERDHDLAKPGLQAAGPPFEDYRISPAAVVIASLPAVLVQDWRRGQHREGVAGLAQDYGNFDVWRLLGSSTLATPITLPNR